MSLNDNEIIHHDVVINTPKNSLLTDKNGHNIQSKNNRRKQPRGNLKSSGNRKELVNVNVLPERGCDKGEDFPTKSGFSSNETSDVPDNILLPMSPSYLDPNQINLILSSLNQHPQNQEVNFDWSPPGVLTLPDPPTFTPSSRIFECLKCPYITLSQDNLTHHASSPHPQPPQSQITCLACSNLFYSVPPLKTHLLLDHEVLNEELQDIILMTLRKNNKYQNSSSSGTNDPHNWRNEASSNEAESQRLYYSNESEIKESIDGGGQDWRNQATNSPPSQSSNNLQPVSISRGFNSSPPSTTSGLTQSDPKLIRLPPFNKNFSYSQNKFKVGGDCGQSVESNESDGSSSDSWQDKSTNDLTISQHLQLMEQLKVTKMSGDRCGIGGCNYRFKFLKNLELHQKCHSKEGWKCFNCDRSYSAWNSLCLHLWTTHSIDVELFYCSQCNFKTTSLSRLKNIHILIHKSEKPFVCQTCGKGFKNGKQLRNHQVIHKSKLDKEGCEMKMECDKCKALFKNARQLKLHKNLVHSKKRPSYKCDTCGHTVSTRSSLVLHFRTHTGEKPYRCKECDYTCSDHNSFRRHLMRHSGLHLYTCPHCPYSSIQSSSFKAHVNSKHPGMLDDVVFSCPLCPFKSLRKEIFLSHASKHSTANPLPTIG